MPEPPLTPLDTKFHPQSPSTIQAWHTRSGHVLVQPKINGQGIGYMMLDTGGLKAFSSSDATVDADGELTD